jgi:hypothetical protein
MDEQGTICLAGFVPSFHSLTRRQFSGHKSLFENHASTSGIGTQSLPQSRPLGTNLQSKILDSPSGTHYTSSALAGRHERSTPTAMASLRSLDEYLAVHTENEELDTELASIQGDIEEITGTYLKRQSEMWHDIDKELPRKHSKAIAYAIAELKARQSEEASVLKAKYAVLKQEQEKETNALKQRQAERLARKEALSRELAERADGISKTDLLDAFIAQSSANKKRKRRESTDSVQ